MNGLFIVLDGIDGCGKSTQAARLAATLQKAGRKTVHLREPGGTPFGEAVRDILLARKIPRGVDAEILAFFAARAELIQKEIEPALAAGSIVVCERWVSSTYAYQAAASGGAAEFVASLERQVVRRSPDLLLLLDLSAAAGRARIQRDHDDIERRGAEYQDRVRAGFLQYAKNHPFARTVDASGTEDEVAESILNIVNPLAGRAAV